MPRVVLARACKETTERNGLNEGLLGIRLFGIVLLEDWILIWSYWWSKAGYILSTQWNLCWLRTWWLHHWPGRKLGFGPVSHQLSCYILPWLPFLEFHSRPEDRRSPSDYNLVSQIPRIVVRYVAHSRQACRSSGWDDPTSVLLSLIISFRLCNNEQIPSSELEHVRSIRGKGGNSTWTLCSSIVGGIARIDTIFTEAFFCEVGQSMRCDSKHRKYTDCTLTVPISLAVTDNML